MNTRQLLYQWKAELKDMYTWSKFNSQADIERFKGECTRLAKNIRELEEAINPKGNDWVDYALKKNLELRKAI